MGAGKGKSRRIKAGKAPLSEQEQRTLHTYEKDAATWADNRSEDPRYWASELETFQQLLPQGKVIDIGSGNGRDARMLAGAGYEVTGIDISASLLAIAEERCPEAEFVNASMYELPFADASFDGAWMVASLLHIPKEKASLVLGEMGRVLSPDGAAFIAVKRGEGEKMVDSDVGERFFAYYQPSELRDLLEGSGFVVSEMNSDRETGGATWVCAWGSKA